MKRIAVPLTDGKQIDNHFGHCEFYGIYTLGHDNEIIGEEILQSQQGCGCKSNIAGVLRDEGVSIMLAGGIGDGAIAVLNSVGIDVIRGCSGIAADVVKLYADGLISDSGNSCAQHHEHGGGHSCGH